MFFLSKVHCQICQDRLGTVTQKGNIVKITEKGAHSTPPQEDFVMDLGGGRYDFYHSLNSGVLGSDDYLRAAPVDDILSSTMTPGTCVVSESEV
jgi:hypothetical protein